MPASPSTVLSDKAPPASTHQSALTEVSTEDQGASGALPFPVVGIGASAGGLEACTQLLQHLPHDTGMAFVLVRHLDPQHESLLTELLTRTIKMPVTQVTQGVAVEPNHVYVIPPNAVMALAQGVLQLSSRGETSLKHLPIDHFLRSLAKEQQSQAIGVILSGTGSDGTQGLAEIKAIDGVAFAQDEQSAKYAGMPRSAIQSGCVDFILSPEAISQELVQMGRHSYLASMSAREQPHSQEEEHFKKTLVLLRSARGVDFTHYRDTTIKRRIMRRMLVHTKCRLADCVQHLEQHREELEALYNAILITVTVFS